MDKFFITCMLGIAVGAVDILPMVKMKLDKYSIASTFVFYFTLPFIILNTELFHVVWWIKGGLICGILALPMIIIVSKEDKKSGLPMLIISTMLGEVIAILAHLFSL